MKPIKYLYIILCILILSASCNKEELAREQLADICNTSDPVRELMWVKELLNKPDSDTQGCYTAILIQGIYHNKTVFVFGISGGPLCCPCAGNPVFNCEGELVFSCNPEEEKKIKNRKVIWQRNK